MHKKFYITGTDTDVGKTLTSAILTLALKGCYWKPIQSGIAAAVSDLDYIQHMTSLSDLHFFPSIYSFQAPLSPDQAAKLEDRSICLEKCILPNTDKTLVVEGAGGIFVPLNSNATQLDLMKLFNLPVIIVARGTLGTINHTLLTIEVLRQRGLTIHGIIFSGKLNPDNQQAIEKWGRVNTLFHIPFFEDVTPTILQNWTNNNFKMIQEKLYGPISA